MSKPTGKPRVCWHRGVLAIEWYEDGRRRRRSLGITNVAEAKKYLRGFRPPARVDEPENKKRLVYFVQCNGAIGPVKIGIAVSVESRLIGMATDNPFPLAVLGVMDGGRAAELEMHAKFAHLRIQGEWFAWTPELGSFIAENTRPLVSRRDGPPLSEEAVAKWFEHLKDAVPLM